MRARSPRNSTLRLATRNKNACAYICVRVRVGIRVSSTHTRADIHAHGRALGHARVLATKLYVAPSLAYKIPMCIYMYIYTYRIRIWKRVGKNSQTSSHLQCAVCSVQCAVCRVQSAIVVRRIYFSPETMQIHGLARRARTNFTKSEPPSAEPCSATRLATRVFRATPRGDVHARVRVYMHTSAH